MNSNNRIVHIDNSIFHFSLKKKGNKWEQHSKHSKFINYINESSLFIFHKNSKIRIFCQCLLSNKFFHTFYIILNGLSCFCLMLDTPYVNPKSKKKKVLHIFEGLSLIFFCLETLIKIIANGLFIPDKNKFPKKTFFKTILDLNSISSLNSINNNSSSFSVSQLILSQISQKSLSLIDSSPKKIYSKNNKEININEILKKSKLENDDSNSSLSKLSNGSLIKLNKNKDKLLHSSNINSDNSSRLNNINNNISHFKSKKDNTSKTPYLRNILNIL